MQIHCSSSYNAKCARRPRNYKFWPLRGNGKNRCKHTVICFMFANKRNNIWSTCCDREFNNWFVRLLKKQWHFRQKDGLLLQSRLKPLFDLSLPAKKVINLLCVSQWHVCSQTQYSLFVFFSVHCSEFSHYLNSDTARRLFFVKLEIWHRVL